jgi:hypothetical protein
LPPFGQFNSKADLADAIKEALASGKAVAEPDPTRFVN